MSDFRPDPSKLFILAGPCVIESAEQCLAVWDLPHVLRTIARARDEDPDVLAAITTENALTLFRWTNSPAGDAS